MYLSWTCTALRMAPVAVLVLVHCSKGHWPSDQEATERAKDLGFSIDLFPERPTSVVTHLFVHVSTEHLLSNVLSLTSTLMEFGGLTVRGNVEEGRKDVAAQRSIASFLVMVVGGVVGGLGGQLVYNDSRLYRRRQEVARLRFQAAHDGQDVGTAISTSASSTLQRLCDSVRCTIGLGGGTTETATTTADAALADDGTLHALFDGVKRKVQSWKWSARIWKARTQADIQEGINNSMLMCGASAGVCALAGFNLTYFYRPVTTMCLVVPEVVVLIHEAYSRSAGAAEDGWRTLMPGQTVGHAAHVGGFVAGAALGFVWRRRMMRHKNAVRSAT